ncbi:hypothetical protein Btru_056972 [Bulinus truncatus]|nr:hypothetical protein Btru_056972 [Bulinus truncatus]
MEIFGKRRQSEHCMKSYCTELGQTQAVESQCGHRSLQTLTRDNVDRSCPSDPCLRLSQFHRNLSRSWTSPKHSGLLLRNFYTKSVHQVISTPNKLSSIFVLVTILFITMSSQISPTVARSVGVCNGIPCANGGKLLVSNSVWGNCRCRCPAGFVGPYCQYQAARKRSVATTTSHDLSERLEILNLIRQRLLIMSQRMREEETDVEVDDNDDDTVDETDMTGPSNAVIDQETTIQAYNRPRRSWYYRDYRKLHSTSPLDRPVRSTDCIQLHHETDLLDPQIEFNISTRPTCYIHRLNSTSPLDRPVRSTD